MIFLSAYGREETIAKALEMGAIDYVVKPFAGTELTARIWSALRRQAQAAPEEPYVVGDLVVDYARQSADPGRPPDRPDAYRVPAPGRTGVERRPRGDLCGVVGPGVGTGALGRPSAAAHRDQEPAPQVGRCPRWTTVHLQPTTGRLPHGRPRTTRILNRVQDTPPSSERRTHRCRLAVA